MELGPRRRSPSELLDHGVQVVNETVKRNHVRLPSRVRLGLRGRRLLVEVPDSIVKVRDVSLAGGEGLDFEFQENL